MPRKQRIVDRKTEVSDHGIGLLARLTSAPKDSMARRIAEHDWSASALGAMQNWSAALLTAVDLCLGSRICSCIYWGDEQLIIYNDAYASILGTKHPWALGRTVDEVWPEIIDVIGPLMRQTFSEGTTTGGDDVAIFLNRSGYVEEFYCSFSYSPIIRHCGTIEGVYATLPETSRRVIGERRLHTLQRLGSELREAGHPDEALRIAADAFEHNPYDVPFASLYLWREDDSGASLVATSNVAPGTPWSPTHISFDAVDDYGEGLRCAIHNEFALLDIPNETRDVPRGAWKIPARKMLAIVLAPYDEAAPRGLILAGLNPHQAFDDEHTTFFRMVTDQVTRAIAIAFTHEQDEARVRDLQQRARSAQEAERLRIARDLHDTLLQSLQGMRFLLEAAIARSATGDASAATLFDNALNAADHAIREGREVLSLLRSTGGDSHTIRTTLTALCDEVATDKTIRFNIDIEGEQREIEQGSWHEMFGYCREAVTNAVRHSNATTVSVVIQFDDPLCVNVTDDGCGIAPEYLDQGRVGHYGLTGMRERAAALGGQLDVESIKDRGTTIRLTVPAERAYKRIYKSPSKVPA